MSDSSRTINKNCQLSTVNCQLFKPGFSLIDILLTMLLVIMFSSILLVGSGSFLTSRKSSLRALASKIASEQIEYARNQVGVSGISYLQPPPPLGCNSHPESGKLPSYSCTLTATDFDPPSANVYLVSINVAWTEDSEPKSVKMETLIYENGLN